MRTQEPTAIIPLTTSEPTGIPIPMRTQEPTAIIPLTTSEPTGIPIPMRTQEPTANDINGANNGNEQNDHDLEKDVEEPQQAATSYTEAPTRLYTTSSPSPYFDGACSVGSEISCRTSGGQSCDYIMGPSHFVCDSYDGYADSVSFMVTGNTCAYTNHCEETYPYQNLEEQQYYVLMQHGYDIVYEGVVEHGRIFTVDARDCGVVTIVISTVPVGFPRPGLPLQVIHRVPLSCLGTAGRDLTLSEDFGALRVVSFSNLDQGVQSIVEEITLTYTIHNYGRVDARVDEAMVQNDFDYEMLNLMEDCEDPTLPAGEHISFDSKPYIVNVVDRNGQDMYTAFLAVQYDNCGDRVRFAVQLADAPETREPYNYPTDYPRTRVPTTPHYYHTESPMTYMPNGMASEIRIIVTHVALQGGSEWRDGTSYQAKAIQWLENDKLAYDGLSQQRIWQRYALACIYFATYAVPNPYTVSSTRGWIDSAGWLEPISECEWFGVNCTRDSFVESLDLSSNRLTGTFPNETMILAGNLTYLDLFQNPVHNHGDDGHIWLIEMYKLQHLFYGSTNFEYHHGIPFYLMELTNLVEFDCSNTLYSGPIEPELFVMWERMEWLSLGGNVYNSTIPMEIGMMPNLQHLYMGDAHLVGGLYFLESMVSPLVDLWLGNNPSLGGTIPTSIAHSPFLESLSLSGCGLSGTIPAEIGLLRELKFLWLFDNMLTGTIPFEMGDLFQLQILELEDNMLMGIMPDQVCSNTGPDGFLSTLEADCGQGNNAYIECSCCTCCVSCGAVPSMVPIHGEMDAHGMRWPRRRSLH
ncbi:leucine rich repeat [Seminavis robusta]|uniref:Leucine rich repeat n=1 Tax=Seminavis robusta TaxID=568900 RepID=A0A9N8H2W5_9STRA|nr:leucine rich repeat [Seminavis robusta]|eukprot:Sro74_g040910.1 leucine rich repeat (805) ;mRNA; f:109217-112234